MERKVTGRISVKTNAARAMLVSPKKISRSDNLHFRAIDLFVLAPLFSFNFLKMSSATLDSRSHVAPNNNERKLTGLDRYTKFGKVGDGTYGVVYKARDKVTGAN